MAITLATPIQFARQITNSNSQSLTDQKAIAYATDTLYNLRKAFIMGGVDAGQIQEAYFTPTAGQGQYNYPTNPSLPFFFLKAIGVNFSDTTQGDYLTASKLDISNTPSGYSFDWLRINQSTQDVLFDDHGSWFEIFPTPQASMNLTAAVKIVYFILPSPYVATTDGLAYPETIDPNLIGYGIAACHLRSMSRFDQADKLEALMMRKIAANIPTMGMASEGPTTPRGLPITGGEF